MEEYQRSPPITSERLKEVVSLTLNFLKEDFPDHLGYVRRYRERKPFQIPLVLGLEGDLKKRGVRGIGNLIEEISEITKLDVQYVSKILYLARNKKKRGDSRDNLVRKIRSGIQFTKGGETELYYFPVDDRYIDFIRQSLRRLNGGKLMLILSYIPEEEEPILQAGITSDSSASYIRVRCKKAISGYTVINPSLEEGEEEEFLQERFFGTGLFVPHKEEEEPPSPVDTLRQKLEELLIVLDQP
jgi:hypothetical protein